MSGNLKKIAIEEASDGQLREFAEITHQLDVAGCRTRADYLAIIAQVWSLDFIMVEAADVEQDGFGQVEVVQKVPQQRIAGAEAAKDPRWVIEISATEQPGGKDPVPVSVNGRALVIQRNQVVDLPHRYVLALMNARRETLRQDMQTGEITRTSFTNYPVQVHERPSKAEIAEWDRQQAGAAELGDQGLGGGEPALAA